jgi:hypothetical protein
VQITLPANIILLCKWLKLTNTLTYYAVLLVKIVKMFMVQVLAVGTLKFSLPANIELGCK